MQIAAKINKNLPQPASRKRWAKPRTAPVAYLKKAYESASRPISDKIREAFSDKAGPYGRTSQTFRNYLAGKQACGPDFWAWLERQLESYGVEVKAPQRKPKAQA